MNPNFKFAPICLFTYNRLEETRKTVDSLKENHLAIDSILYIFSDGPKDKEGTPKVQAVRDLLRAVEGFKNVIIKESNENKGLANSIINGVSEVIEKHGKVIVLEDDLITSKNFLDFMNAGLLEFEDSKEVFAINGYSPFLDGVDYEKFAIYYHPRACSWGWATWLDNWDRAAFEDKRTREIIEEDPSTLLNFKKNYGDDVVKMLKNSLSGKNNSWYIRWIFHNSLKKNISVFPVLSKVENIGFNSDGTHCNELSTYKSKLDFSDNTDFEFSKVFPLKKNDYNFRKYFSKRYKLFYRLKLLSSSGGRNLLKKDLKSKLFKK